VHGRRTGGGEVDELEEYHAKRGARGGREVAEAVAVPSSLHFFPGSAVAGLGCTLAKRVEVYFWFGGTSGGRIFTHLAS